MNHNIPKYFSFATGSLGLKKDQDDLLLISCQRPAICAGVFTLNSFPGSPVIVSKKNLKKSKGKIKAVLANAGCSNVATGEKGIKDSEESARILAEQIGCRSENILLASTGVIGEFLPMEQMRKEISKLPQNQNQAIEPAAKAIMTTDTVHKISSKTVGKAAILGIAKGVGMVEPNMATMLAFILTDAKINLPKLQKMWREIVDDTFNMLSVDACESTSDTALVLASQEYNVDEIKFKKGLAQVALELTKKLASDGEGATILIEATVNNAPSKTKARALAKAVIKSDLVKTAVNGRDANWGRIIGALGSTHFKINIAKISIKIDDQTVFQKGAPAKKINEAKIFQKNSAKIEIDLSAGKYSATAWGCDLSKEYVRINGDYRS